MFPRPTHRLFALYLSITLALSLFGGLLLLYSPTTHAQSQPDALGTLRGTIRNDDGAPLPNVSVALISSAYGYNSVVRTATTNAQGNYSLVSIPPGTYSVKFEDNTRSYATEYYDNQIIASDAKFVSVSGNEVTGIDAELSQGGSISITTTFSITPSQANLSLTLYRQNTLGYWMIADTLYWPYGDPELVFYGLPAGVYRLCYSGYIYPYSANIDECYEDALPDRTVSPPSNATDIVVNAGDQTRINLTIDANSMPDALLQGKVVSPKGEPVPFAQLLLVDDYFQTYSFADAEGRFVFSYLPDGNYAIQAYVPQGNYLPTYYDKATTITDAVRLRINANSRYSITLEMFVSGSITGRVRVQGGAIPSNLGFSIYMRMPDGTWGDGFFGCQPYGCGFAYQPNTGAYTVTGLVTGVYRLQATESTATPYQLHAFYGGHNLETANDIAVTTGQTTANINFELAHGRFDGAITGAATANGTPQAGLDVGLFIPNTYGGSPLPQVSTVTDAQGNYRFDGLPGGHYYVGVRDPDGEYAINFYGGNPLQPATIVITGAHTVDNVNVALAPGSTIRGKIKRHGDKPVVGFQLHVRMQQGWLNFPFIQAKSDSNGNYVITGLPPGEYWIGASSPECCGSTGFVSFYPRGRGQMDLHGIMVGENVVVSGIDIPYDGQAGAFLPMLGAPGEPQASNTPIPIVTETAELSVTATPTPIPPRP